MKNQKGFGAVEGLLLLVLVALIGFSGWYVLQARNKTDSVYDSTGSSATGQKTSAKTDSTADWITYSSTTNNYSLKHPKDWVSKECDVTLLLAAADQYLGKCNSDSTGQMTVGVLTGDYQTQLDTTKSSACASPSKEAVRADEVSGYKYGCTVAEGQLVGPPAGTQSTEYVFYTGGKTYVFNYFGLSGAPNVLSDYNQIVTKTLKFQP